MNAAGGGAPTGQPVAPVGYGAPPRQVICESEDKLDTGSSLALSVGPSTAR